MRVNSKKMFLTLKKEASYYRFVVEVAYSKYHSYKANFFLASLLDSVRFLLRSFPFVFLKT